ncbi:MAG: hypothetical protein RR248_04140 [Clostridia bacterium]
MNKTTKPKLAIAISTKSFISVMCILLALIILAGTLTYIVPRGTFLRTIVNGKEQIVPNSYMPLAGESGISIVKWIFAPILVLASSDSLNIIVISILLLVLAGAFSIIESTGGIKVLALRLIKKFSSKKDLLIWAVVLFFMLISSLFGIFEETLVLLPLMFIVARSMNWDTTTALSMSVLASGIGFSCPLFNPFTIGIAYQIVGGSMLSAIWFRLIIFVLMWVLTSFFVSFMAKRHEVATDKLDPTNSQSALDLNEFEQANERKIFLTFIIFFISVITVMILASAIPVIVEQGLTMVLIMVVFLFGSLSCGIIVTKKVGLTLKYFGKGIFAMLPGVLILLMASSVKYIAVEGKILDTIMNSLTISLVGVNPYLCVLAIYGIVLLLEFFISSGSAKAYLIMPILQFLCIDSPTPIGISINLAILAFVFGDGFTNMFFPTNAVLLIGLSMSNISYGQWIKRNLVYIIIVLVVTSGLLLLGQAIGV